ncbi:MAG: [Fe-Fe] hydrogenase large subunit C-terminal domain-containing protein [Oscillospiraceae bacterium]
MVKLEIDGKEARVPEGTTILDAAKEIGVSIPTLCYLKNANRPAACRMCVVEVMGQKAPVPACSIPVREGMQVFTSTPKIVAARKMALELICANHKMNCTDCPQGMDCRLRELCKEYQVNDRAFGMGKRENLLDESSGHLVRDNSKCILCRRCAGVCANMQKIGAVEVNNRAGNTTVGFGVPHAKTNCIACGQCISACPTGALSVKDNTKLAWKAIFDKKKFVIAGVLPKALEQVNWIPGKTNREENQKRIVAMLKRIGFDVVVNLEDYEEDYRAAVYTEAVCAKRNCGSLPLLSAACPAFRNYIEKVDPQDANRVLRVDSLWEYMAGILKKQYCDRDTVFVAVDACAAEKAEVNLGRTQKVDVSLTHREVIAMWRSACVSSFTAAKVWESLPEEKYDELPKPKEISTATKEAGTELKIGIVHGMHDCMNFLQDQSFDLIEVQACPEGCAFGNKV